MRTVRSFAVVAVAALVAACASSGQQLAESVAEKTRRVKSSTADFETVSRAALAELDALCAAPAPDLAAHFKTFQHAVEVVNAAEDTVRANARKVDEAARDRFETWERENREIANPEIAQHAEARRRELSSSYLKSKAVTDAGVVHVGAFADHLVDVRRNLSNDLTPPGVAAAAPFVKSLHKEFDEVADFINDWNKELAKEADLFSTAPSTTK